MQKLDMCRICLREDVPMQSIVDTHLQDIYESLTLTPFETDDNRPDVVCFICCEKLQMCYRLSKRCLQSEQLFTWKLNTSVVPQAAPIASKEVCNAVTVNEIGASWSVEDEKHKYNADKTEHLESSKHSYFLTWNEQI